MESGSTNKESGRTSLVELGSTLRSDYNWKPWNWVVQSFVESGSTCTTQFRTKRQNIKYSWNPRRSEESVIGNAG